MKTREELRAGRASTMFGIALAIWCVNWSAFGDVHITILAAALMVVAAVIAKE